MSDRDPRMPAVPAATDAAPAATPAPVAEPSPVARVESALPAVGAASSDVTVADSAPLPGEHRGGFQREFTEPVPIAEPVAGDSEWAGSPASTTIPVAAEALPRSAAWALVFGILGLLVSFLVGWGFLIGLVGAGLAIAALRRPWESRQVAVWALCLSLVSVVYSAGWLWWASTQGPLFG